MIPSAYAFRRAVVTGLANPEQLLVVRRPWLSATTAAWSSVAANNRPQQEMTARLGAS
jgi:hypothetical protein